MCLCEQEVDNIYDEQKLQYRVGALSGGIAAIKVRESCRYKGICRNISIREIHTSRYEKFIDIMSYIPILCIDIYLTRDSFKPPTNPYRRS